MDLVKLLLINVLDSLYQVTIFSLIVSILFMFAYMLFREQGWKSTARKWITAYKEDKQFKQVFYLAIYVTMISFRTLFNRGMWLHPLSDVVGVWGIYDETGTLTTENIENLMLFIPFTILYLWAFSNSIIKDRFCFLKVVWRSTTTTFLISFVIEFLQLFLRVGTFQLSDLFYNTLGGLIGGFLYWIGYKITHRKK